MIEFSHATRRRVQFFVVVAAALLAGFIMGWVRASSVSTTRLDRIVAISCGDGKYGPAFYGAQVYLEPASGGYSVRARVHIGRGNDQFHECGELGRVRTDAEAVARWGTIVWSEDGLHIGSGSDEYFLARARIENHR